MILNYIPNYVDNDLVHWLDQLKIQIKSKIISFSINLHISSCLDVGSEKARAKNEDVVDAVDVPDALARLISALNKENIRIKYSLHSIDYLNILFLNDFVPHLIFVN